MESQFEKGMRFSTTQSERQPRWPEIIFEIYRTCRKFPNWEILKAQHDEEDKDYFDMLDDLMEKKKIEIQFEVEK